MLKCNDLKSVIKAIIILGALCEVKYNKAIILFNAPNSDLLNTLLKVMQKNNNNIALDLLNLVKTLNYEELKSDALNQLKENINQRLGSLISTPSIDYKELKRKEYFCLFLNSIQSIPTIQIKNQIKTNLRNLSITITGTYINDLISSISHSESIMYRYKQDIDELKKFSSFVLSSHDKKEIENYIAHNLYINADIYYDQSCPLKKRVGFNLFWSAVEQNHAKSCADLAKIYEEKSGLVPQNFVMSLSLFRKSYTLGNKEVCNAIGYSYHHSEGARYDYHRAKLWYKRGIKHGDTTSYYNLGMLLFANNEYSNCFKTFVDGALKKERDCMFRLHQMLSQSEMLNKQDLLYREKDQNKFLRLENSVQNHELRCKKWLCFASQSGHKLAAEILNDPGCFDPYFILKKDKEAEAAESLMELSKSNEDKRS